jgi:hypothetical protein
VAVDTEQEDLFRFFQVHDADGVIIRDPRALPGPGEAGMSCQEDECQDKPGCESLHDYLTSRISYSSIDLRMGSALLNTKELKPECALVLKIS